MKDITQEIFDGQPKKATLEAFYQNLAAAITSWQRVELALHHVAIAAMRPRLTGAFSAGFHALEHTAAQLRMTDAAVHFWLRAHPGLPNSFPDTWATLKPRINKELQCRNRLAHFTVFVAPQRKREHEKIYLQPAVTDARYPHGSPKTRFGLSEIQAAGARFVKLSQKMLDYQSDMLRLAAQYEELRRLSDDRTESKIR